MTKKEKEEERIERIIRGLLKQPENRRCINCNSLGPQYVCTTFLTFVCTNCSGVHREFTHRVKSVSMAKFNAEEVSALQAGGNERARQLYFKNWDPQRHSYPDGSNLHRLRDFIKHVYVDRKYSGDRARDRLPRLRLSEKEDSYDSRKVSLYTGGSRSPTYEDRYERRSHPVGRSDDKTLKYYFDERRSPRYAPENSRYGGLKRSPVRFEVVDDRFRDDGIPSGRESDNRRFSHRQSSFRSLSPDCRKHMDRSSSPVIRPVKDILGESAPRLQVGEHSKATDRKDVDVSAHNQPIASSSSKGSNEGKAVKDKNQNSESLIDFNALSMISDAAAAPQTRENHQSRNEGNCNSDESSTKQDATGAPKQNTLEFLLYELSVSSVESVGSKSDLLNNENPSTTSGGNALMSGDNILEAVSLGQMLTLRNNNNAPTTAPGGNVPMAGVSPTASMGLMSALPNISGASATSAGGDMPIFNNSSVASAGQLSTSSDSTTVSKSATGDSMFVGGISPAAPVEKALSLLDTFDTTAPSATSLPVQPSNEGTSHALPDIQGDCAIKVPNVQQVSGMQHHQHSVFPPAEGRPGGKNASSTTVEALNNQPWTSLGVPNAQGPSSVSAEYTSQNATKADQDPNPGIKSQHIIAESKTSGREELPADLFSARYSAVPGSIPGWQSAVPYGMRFNVQHYSNTMPMQPYPRQATSSNPFDFSNDTSLMQVSPFPSNENLRVAIPNMSAPRALSPTSGIDKTSSGLMAIQAPPYASAMPLQTSAFPSPTSSGAYMGQQVNMNIPPSGPQAGGGFGGDAFLGSPYMVQQSSSGCPSSSGPNSVPFTGGNPFG
ncbi:conserved hypothetical protein [Ricinus communis]|uniref:Arf-GAP domain-containing protein n=1 Tax=Ricinus communis TaxID=3988 RepID=B9RS84_RICCO|nr:conserved hypothetical protein [Ricinus communis]|eukprot:XP_002516603.1 uncharacterized protein LOC8272156 isoform X1 [Ricinus communis]